MAQGNHEVIWVAGLGAAAFAGYELLYKPWKASQDAAALAATGSLTSSYVNTSAGGNTSYGAPYITTPTNLPITPSNLNPGAAVGGPVGTCMSRKGFTQSECQQKLDALVATFNKAKNVIAGLQPGGPMLVAAQTQLAATQVALNNATQGYNTALAQGDQGGSLIWRNAIDAHQADIAALNKTIQAVPARIVAAQATMAGAISDYQALTGLTLQ